MPRRGPPAACAALAALLAAGPAAGQDTAPPAGAPQVPAPTAPQGPAQTPIVTLDQEALFLRSRFGLRVQREIEQERDALAAENRRIEAELIGEEQALTEQRAQMTPAEFAPLAEAFDAKVQRIRQQQDQKSTVLQRRLESERQTFFSAVGPILIELLRERGAVAVVDRNAILLAFEGLDVTAAAVALIDDRLGDGTGAAGAPAPPPTPDPAAREGE